MQRRPPRDEEDIDEILGRAHDALERSKRLLQQIKELVERVNRALKR